MRRLISIGCFLLVACVGCDGPAPVDGGGTDGGRADAGDGASVCSRPSDCDDGVFCNGTERCEPGNAAALANGCVSESPPCSSDQICNEVAQRCDAMTCPADPDQRDMDGDGHEISACAGGDDCDDDDPLRYPGGSEVCGAGGDSHDEDCRAETLAGPDDGDSDGDGFTSNMCCNGESCGDDCDDDDINVNPGATETCNGVDDDCDGVIDGGGSLCPGGSCLAGHCDFDAWDKTFGTADGDVASAIAFDAAGNIYVAGSVGEGTVNFGGPDRSVTTDAIAVVKYAPDGRYEWDYVGPTGGLVTGLAVDPTGTRIYLVGTATGDLGSGTAHAPFVMMLDGSGAYVWDHRFGGSYDALNGIALNAEGVLAIGKFWETVNFGGDDIELGRRDTMILLQLDPDGAYIREHVFANSDTGGFSVGYSVAVGSGGEIVIGGAWSGTLPLGSTELSGNGSFIAELDASGAPQWAHAITMTPSYARAPLTSVAIGPSGRVYGIGHYTGAGTIHPDVAMAYGSTTGNFGTSSGDNGFVIGLASDGTGEWARSFGTTCGTSGCSDVDTATDVAVDSAGNVSVVGQFSTPTDFGTGPRPPVSHDGFMARFADDGAAITEVVYSMSATSVNSVAVGPGGSTAICGSFAGTSNFGSGPRVSRGGADGFVLRLGS